MKHKAKYITALLVAIPLISGSSLATNSNKISSIFTLRLFNSTHQTQPLQYMVKPYGKDPIGGWLYVGDDHGAAMNIDAQGWPNAEIQVKDQSGHMIWNATIGYEDKAGFYTKTLSLDSQYRIGTHALPTVHAISFDIQS